MWVKIGTLAVQLLINWIKKQRNGKEQLEDALAREEIVEDKLEKRIILKADDCRSWFRKWQYMDDARTQKKYLHYLCNKYEEYDALRRRLGTE